MNNYFEKVTTSKGLKISYGNYFLNFLCSGNTQSDIWGGVRGNAYPAGLYLTYGAGAGVTPTQPRAGTDSDIIDRWLKTGLPLFFSL